MRKGDVRSVLVKLADLDDNMDPEYLAAFDRQAAARLAVKYQRACEFSRS